MLGWKLTGCSAHKCGIAGRWGPAIHLKRSGCRPRAHGSETACWCPAGREDDEVVFVSHCLRITAFTLNSLLLLASLTDYLIVFQTEVIRKLLQSGCLSFCVVLSHPCQCVKVHTWSYLALKPGDIKCCRCQWAGQLWCVGSRVTELQTAHLIFSSFGFILPCYSAHPLALQGRNTRSEFSSYLNASVTAKVKVKFWWVSDFGVHRGACRNVATLPNL